MTGKDGRGNDYELLVLVPEGVIKITSVPVIQFKNICGHPSLHFSQEGRQVLRGHIILCHIVSVVEINVMSKYDLAKREHVNGE